MPTEPWRARAHRLLPSRAWRLGGALALGVLANACAVTPTPPEAARPQAASAAAGAAPATPAPDSGQTLAQAAPTTSAMASAAVPTSTLTNAGEQEATLALLRYADRVRALTPAELALEIASLGDPGQQPLRQMQLAIALMHSSQPVETARALGLAQRVAASPSGEASPYRPVARLLAQRLMEQRKLEETVDRQAQQMREQQRRIEQLNERLEAMRAIERSLNNRAPAAAPRPITP